MLGKNSKFAAKIHSSLSFAQRRSVRCPTGAVVDETAGEATGSLVGCDLVTPAAAAVEEMEGCERAGVSFSLPECACEEAKALELRTMVGAGWPVPAVCFSSIVNLPSSSSCKEGFSVNKRSYGETQVP